MGTEDGYRNIWPMPVDALNEELAVMPSGVIVFPGSGITENLRDGARRLGINIWELKGDGA